MNFLGQGFRKLSCDVHAYVHTADGPTPEKILLCRYVGRTNDIMCKLMIDILNVVYSIPAASSEKSPN